jgi:3-phosphoshikimate 1-carboxyvinyltransferase
MAQLGAGVDRGDDGIRIRGGRLRAPDAPLDLGNSGTGMRLLAGALCGHPDLHGARVELVGDASLSRRPMNRIIEPLRAMGARIDGTHGCAPLHVWPRRLAGVRWRSSVASAQVKSAVLLAALSAAGETRVDEPAESRDHTERMLPAFGVPVQRAGLRASLAGPVRLDGVDIDVPGDLSSAAFTIAAAALVPGSEVRIGPVGTNPTRDGLLRILRRMDVAVEIEPLAGRGVGAEPVAMLIVSSPTRPVGCDVPAEWVSLAIDEFPVVMALAAAADGVTTISGAEELRVKESDRIAVMVRQLRRLGVDAEERADGARIRGGAVRGGRVDAEGDHRIAMSLAVLGLVADGPVAIDGAEWIRTSYPDFSDHIGAIGGEARWT